MTIAALLAACAISGGAITNGMQWIDGSSLPIEGQGFAQTAVPYGRMPAGVTTNVNAGVRGMGNFSTGLQLRFHAKTKKLSVRWTLAGAVGGQPKDFLSPTARAGIDIYRRRADGIWRFVKLGVLQSPTEGLLEIADWGEGDCLVNLPGWSALRDVSVGVDETGTVTPLKPRANGVTKPVVFYGTSITHGSSASRPGMTFVSQVGRHLDVPVVNLGFSGSGVMEFEMSEHLAKIDASCYVLDCLWNMFMTDAPDPRPSYRYRCVDENYEPFIRNLRAKRPGVPIVMAEQCDVRCGPPNKKDLFIRKLYEKLVAEGWQNLVYLPKAGMYPPDGDGTVDGCHATDLGMTHLALAFEKAVGTALGLSCDRSAAQP